MWKRSYCAACGKGFIIEHLTGQAIKISLEPEGKLHKKTCPKCKIMNFF